MLLDSHKGESVLAKLKTGLLSHKEAIAYLIFGGLTTLVGILCYAGLSRIFVRFMDSKAAMNAANLLSILTAILFAYATNRRYVFLSRTKGRAALAEFVSFFMGRAFTLVLDMALMNLLVLALHVWDIAAKVAVNILVIVLNYVIAKRFVFRKGRDASAAP